jgi:aspartyl-tRNA(Asn)/glutamyl-tRNA(Gln) amidotransferase subunit A
MTPTPAHMSPQPVDLIRQIEIEGRKLGAVEAVIPSAAQLLTRCLTEEQTERPPTDDPTHHPLQCLPFAVKANIDVAGIPTTSGLVNPAAPIASRDAVVVSALRAVGAVPVVTTTMAPLAIGAVTTHPVTGHCRNPRDQALHAGGSSGGSGAIVGAGLVPFALGSDTMGSVRIPAAYCGVYGWLPTHGSVSTTGLTPLAEPLDNVGVLASDPHLLAAVAAVLSQPDSSNPWSYPTSPEVAITDAPSFAVCDWGNAADGAHQLAVKELIAHLRTWGGTDRGVISLDTATGVEPGWLRRQGLLLVEAAAADTFADEWAGGLIPSNLLPLLDFGRALPAPRLWRAVRSLATARRNIRLALSGVDCLILPTTPTTAPALTDDPGNAADLTAWVNVAGQPVVVIPWGNVSLQCVGAPGSDSQLLAWTSRIHRERHAT